MRDEGFLQVLFEAYDPALSFAGQQMPSMPLQGKAMYYTESLIGLVGDFSDDKHDQRS